MNELSFTDVCIILITFFLVLFIIHHEAITPNQNNLKNNTNQFQNNHSLSNMYRASSLLKNYKTCIMTFKIARNRNTILLPFVLKNVFCVRVKHLTWLSNPLVAPAINTMMWISCPEIYINNPNQSAFLLLNPADPTGQHLNVFRKDIIASFNIAPVASNTPNHNNNDPQPKIYLERMTNLTMLTFEFDADNELNFEIELADDVSVTMEFYLINSVIC